MFDTDSMPSAFKHNLKLLESGCRRKNKARLIMHDLTYNLTFTVNLSKLILLNYILVNFKINHIAINDITKTIT